MTAIGGRAKRSFELVRQSLVQGDGLPFADGLTAEQMQQAFDDEGISFGEDDRETNVFSAPQSGRRTGFPDPACRGVDLIGHGDDRRAGHGALRRQGDR